MIKVINNISEVSFKLFGEALDENILEKQINGEYKAILPFRFNYNGSWLIENKCPQCNAKCNFGLLYDKSKSPYSDLTFKHTAYLCYKYYDRELLDFVAKLFQNTKLISNANGDFVIFDNFYDDNFPITSSIQPGYYECKECHSEFLFLSRMNFPYSPDQGCPAGLIGQIFIDEIIQINIDGSERFNDLLEKHRKRLG